MNTLEKLQVRVKVTSLLTNDLLNRQKNFLFPVFKDELHHNSKKFLKNHSRGLCLFFIISPDLTRSFHLSALGQRFHKSV